MSGMEALGHAVIVLGMHRSGTSCLTGSLHAAGLYLGEVNIAAPHNRKGNRENLAVMELNDRVMAANGGSWCVPPSKVMWPADLARERDVLVAGLARQQPWGFKDPRTLITLEGWLERLKAPALVATYRHPVAVAKSLHRRNPSIEVEEGLQLWRTYNERLIALAATRQVAMVSFDWSPDRYIDAVTSMAVELGLPEPGGVASFPDAALQHQSVADVGDLPPEMARIYAALEELSG